MEQNFKNYKAFDYSIKTRKKMNDVDLSYVPRFLLVSVITDKTYEYVEKEKKLYVRQYTDKMIPIDRIHEIICTVPTKIVLKTPIGNGLEIDNCYDGKTKRISYDKDNAYETIEVGQSAAHIYNQLYRNCSNLPYTPYGGLADSKEEKLIKTKITMICCKEKLKYVLHYVRKIFKDYSVQYEIFGFFGLLSFILRNVEESYSHLLYSYKHHVCFKKVEAYLIGRVIHKYHDVDKIVMYALFPWLGVECINHIHTLWQDHHPCYKDLDGNKAYKPKDEVEWTEAVVDWECARFTKPDKPLNAYDTYLKYYYTSEYTGVIINTLISLGLLSVKTTDAGVVYKVTDKMDDFKYK